MKGTLALNMIIGAGESDNLHRCLSSIPYGMFDEIVLVNTSEDGTVTDEALRWTEKVYQREWASDEFPYGDFAGARNTALKNTVSDFVMWLDADDVLGFKSDADDDKRMYIDNLRKILAEKSDNVDGYFMRYILTFDRNGTPLKSFYRDRIFRNGGALKWQRPVHELLTQNWDSLERGKIAGIDVIHLSDKPAYTSATRNIAILEHEYFTKGIHDEHTSLFLARDYAIIGKIDESLEIYNKLVGSLKASPSNLYMACLHVACWFMFGGFESRPEIGRIQMQNEKAIESWLRMAISFCQAYAEPYVLLGDLYFRRGQDEAAERMYKIALSKEMTVYGVHCTTYYEELPAARIAWITQRKKDFEQALFYNKRALIHDNSNAEYIEQRTYLLTKLMREMEVYSIQEEKPI